MTSELSAHVMDHSEAQASPAAAGTLPAFPAGYAADGLTGDRSGRRIRLGARLGRMQRLRAEWQRFRPAATTVAAALAATGKVVVFLVALYLIYVVTQVLHALPGTRREGLLARAAGRARYLLWRLERRAFDAEA